MVSLPKGVALLSDLHAECQLGRACRAIDNVLEETPEPRVLILAGDIGNVGGGSLADTLDHAVAAMKAKNPKGVVVFVPGNHDYYGLKLGAGGLALGDAILETICDEAGCVFLQRSAVAVGACVIAGTTLWTPVATVSPGEVQYMCDYTRIGGLTVEEVQDTHENQAAWLASICADEETCPQVIVTHHAPFAGNLRSRHYTKESEALFHVRGFAVAILAIAASRVRLWAFGHTHVRGAVTCGKTMVAANCLGHFTDRLHSLPGSTLPHRGALKEY